MLKEFLIYITGIDVISSVYKKNATVYKRYLGYYPLLDTPWDLPTREFVEIYGNRVIGMVKYPLVMSVRWTGIDLLAKGASKILHR